MKTGRILITIILLATIMAFIIPSMPAIADSKLYISSPDDGDLVSWMENLTITWNKIDNAAGYYVRVKNLETNDMLVDSKWTTSLSYTIKRSTIPHSDAGYRIWVGAVASSYDTVSDTFTSDTIEIYIAAEPEISDVYASNITQTSVVLSMTIDKNNGKSITDYGFYLGTSSRISSMEKYSYGSTTKGTKTKTITGLTPGTTYYFRGFAKNAVGEEYSDADSFVTAGGKLDDPVITYPIDGNTYYTGSSIKLQWEGVDNTDGYTYHIKQLSGTPDWTNNEAYVNYWSADVSSSRQYYTFSSSNLMAGYWYKFVVEAYANGMNSAYSDYCYVYIDQKRLDDPIITYPINGDTYSAGTSIKLQWNAVSGADGYRYHIKQLVGTPDPSSNNENSVNTWSNTTANKYYTLSAGNIKGGYWYKFVVEAYASDAASSYSDYCYVYIEKTSLDDPIVVAPANTATFMGYQSVKLDWNTVANADGYNVYIKRLSGMPDRTDNNEPSLASWTDSTSSNITEYSLESSNFVPGYWYKFVVEAYADGFYSSWSEWIYCYFKENHLDDPLISAPSNWAEVTAGRSIEVDWNNVSGAKGYRCHVKQLAGEPDTGNIDELAVNTWREDCGAKSNFELDSSRITQGYWYKFIVEAYSSTASSWSNSVYVYVARGGSLGRPVIISPLAGKDYQADQDIYFSWSRVENASNYTYYVKELIGEPDYSDNEKASNIWQGTTGASKRYFSLDGKYIQPNTWYKFVVQAMADGFDSGWSRYTYIKIPDREDWIYYVLGNNTTTISEEAFAGNTLLRTFDASSSNLMVIESGAFKDCINLQSINLPESVYDIDDDAFANCPNLTIHCIAGSCAESFANSKGIPTVIHGLVKETDILQLSQTIWSISTVDAAQTVVHVTSSSGWTASSNKNWITLNKSSGIDGDQVVLSVSSNTGTKRSGTVTFVCGEAIATIQVNQNTSNPHKCTLNALPNFWEPSSDQLTCDIIVQSSNGFTVSSDASWLTFTKSNGTVTANVTSASLNTSKTGKLTITCGDCGATVTVTVSIKGKYVPAPTGLRADIIDPHALRVSWNPISGASYIVERSDDNEVSWHQIRTLGVGETSFMDDDNIGALTSHYYRVYAQKTISGSTVRSEASESFSAITPTEGRITFTGTYGSIDEGASATLADLSTLTWNAVDGAISYDASLRNLNSPTAVSGYPKTGLTDRSLSIGGNLTQGSEYVVWVAAYNQYGHTIAQGSKTFYVKNPNAPKPTITITSISPASVNNSGKTPFAIQFTATNATSFSFEFDGLQVWEKWDKTSSPTPRGESSIWTFDISEIKNWTVSFYPKAESKSGNYTVTVTAYGDGKQETATATINVYRLSDFDKAFTESAYKFSNILIKESAHAMYNAYSDPSEQLTNLGFDRITSGRITDIQSHSVGYYFARKRKDIIDEKGNTVPLFAIIIRGTSGEFTGPEWGSNFVIGNEIEHFGFNSATIDVWIAFQKYLSDEWGMSEARDKYKVWITGHSRGAAVGNLLAGKYFAHKPNDDVYAYLFATPRTTKAPNENANIRNFIFEGDPVPRVPLKTWGFGRYGIDTFFPNGSVLFYNKRMPTGTEMGIVEDCLEIMVKSPSSGQKLISDIYGMIDGMHLYLKTMYDLNNFFNEFMINASPEAIKKLNSLIELINTNSVEIQLSDGETIKIDGFFSNLFNAHLQENYKYWVDTHY